MSIPNNKCSRGYFWYGVYAVRARSPGMADIGFLSSLESRHDVRKSLSFAKLFD